MDAPNPFKPDNDDEGIVNLDEPSNPFSVNSKSSTNQFNQWNKRRKVSKTKSTRRIITS